MNRPPLPEAFLHHAAERLGNEAEAFAKAMDAEPTRGLRLNPLKHPASDVPGSLSPVPWVRDACYLDASSPAGAVPLHEFGAWYLQEPSAMIPAAVLNAQPGEMVLDLCAAPGGKATQSGLNMQGQGLLVCNEPVPKRAQILSRNIERMGIPNALVISSMPDALAKRWPSGFDAVQVDAPCSGEGMFRKHPETRLEWTPGSPESCAERQADILDAAAVLVRPGGRIVYSTCTLNTIENEGTVQAFIGRHPDFHLQPFSLPGVEAPEGMFTCWPHRFSGEGHFTALLIRDGNGVASLPQDTSLPKPDRAALTVYRSFAKNAPEATHCLGQTLVSIPFLPDVKGLKLYRCGLHLGEVRGKVFLPDHAWALCFDQPDFPIFRMSDEEALAWIRGEGLSVPEDCRGWMLAVYDDLAAGWGKASGGQLKCHYPKGLRRHLYAQSNEEQEE